MSEKQDLKREIQRVSEIIGASESALKAKAMSASDRAWLTKQLGLRRTSKVRHWERLRPQLASSAIRHLLGRSRIAYGTQLRLPRRRKMSASKREAVFSLDQSFVSE